MVVPVPDQLEYISDADGVTKDFPYPKRFLQKDEIVVLLRNADGVDTPQILNTHYTIAGSSWPNGGTITFNVAPASGLKVVRYRMTQAKQTVDLENNQRNDAPSVELQLDRMVMAVQDRDQLLNSTAGGLVAEIAARKEGDRLLNSRVDKEIIDRENGDKAIASLIGQAGDIEVPVFDTRLAVSFAEIKPTLNTIRTGGYDAPGDGGGALYKRVETEPSHAGKVQSADGVWWEEVKRSGTLSFWSNQRVPERVSSILTTGFTQDGDGGGALYKRVSVEPSHAGKFQSADGSWWEITERRPQLPMFGYPAMTVETITARMAAGDAVKIICYGDSTTDGNGTTGWTANPTSGGEAIGTIDHAATAPNAWPARLEAILRDMFNNNNIRCFNAGYSGQRMDNGWAYRNYNQAVIDNPAYGAGDMVFIGFGLNDIVDAGSQADEHIEQTRRVILKVMSYGAVPVLLTCDAFWRNEASTRDAIEAQRTINQAKIGLAKELGIECFDVNMAMQRWFGTNNEGYDWNTIQPDALHVNDIGHRFKAGFIASRLFRDTLFVNEGDRIRTVAGDTRFRTAIGQDRVYTGEGAAQRGAMNVIFPLGSYTAETEAGSAWVWNEAEDAVLVYRALDNNGISVFDNGPRIALTNQQSGGVYHNEILSNSGGVFSSTLRTADRPVFVNYLPFGLSKVTLISPKSTDTSWFHGYLEVNTQTRNISRRLTRRSGSVHSVNGLKETGELFWQTSQTGIAVSLSSEAKDLSNVIEYGRPGALCILLIECKISFGMGFTILSGRGWDPVDGAFDNASKLLFRGGGGDLSLYDLHRTPGGVWTFGASVTITPWGADEYRKLRIDFFRDAGTGQKRMNFYSGWGTGTFLTSVVESPGSFFPSSGYFGDLFSNSASHGGGDRTVHIKSAQILSF